MTNTEKMKTKAVQAERGDELGGEEVRPRVDLVDRGRLDVLDRARLDDGEQPLRVATGTCADRDAGAGTGRCGHDGADLVGHGDRATGGGVGLVAGSRLGGLGRLAALEEVLGNA